MFYVTNPMMFVTFAGEMPLQMALILWGLVAYRAERPQIAAAILACAALTRPDGLLAAAVVFGYDVVVRRRILWRAWLVFAAIVAPFVIATWVVYGSPLPGTLSAKLAQRDSGYWATYFGKGLRGWFKAFLLASVDGPRVEFFSIDPGTLSFWATIGVLAIAGYRFWALPFVWILLFVMIYRTMKVPFYHWYAAPALVGLSIVTGAGLAALLSLARRVLALKRAEGPLLVARGRGARRPRRLSVSAGAAGDLQAARGGRRLCRRRPLAARSHPARRHRRLLRDWLRRLLLGPPHRRFAGAGGSEHPAARGQGRTSRGRSASGGRPTSWRSRGPGALNSFTEEPWFAAEYRERLVFAPPGDPNNHRVILYERRDFSARGGSR